MPHHWEPGLTSGLPCHWGARAVCPALHYSGEPTDSLTERIPFLGCKLVGLSALGKASGLMDASLKHGECRVHQDPTGPLIPQGQGCGHHSSLQAQPSPGLGRVPVHLLMLSLVPVQSPAWEDAQPAAHGTPLRPPDGQQA